MFFLGGSHGLRVEWGGDRKSLVPTEYKGGTIEN